MNIMNQNKQISPGQKNQYSIGKMWPKRKKINYKET